MKSVTYRERERDDTETSERVRYHSVCSFKKERQTGQNKRSEKRIARTNQREKEFAPTKKVHMLGLLTHLGVAMRLARRAFAQSTSHTFEPSSNLVSKPSITKVNTRVLFSESAHPRRIKMRSAWIFTRTATTRFGTRWWVHHVVDPASREGSLGYIKESPRRCSSGTLWVCRFFWREIFVLPALVILY